MGGEGDDRGWDGWMASLTRWTRVWASSGSWWWTGRPGVLQSMGSQRVGHDRVTDLNWTPPICHEVMGPEAMILVLFECWVLNQHLIFFWMLSFSVCSFKKQCLIALLVCSFLSFCLWAYCLFGMAWLFCILWLLAISHWKPLSTLLAPFLMFCCLVLAHLQHSFEKCLTAVLCALCGCWNMCFRAILSLLLWVPLWVLVWISWFQVPYQEMNKAKVWTLSTAKAQVSHVFKWLCLLLDTGWGHGGPAWFLTTGYFFFRFPFGVGRFRGC